MSMVLMSEDEIRREVARRVSRIPGWADVIEGEIRIFPPPDGSSSWTAHVPHPTRHAVEAEIDKLRAEIALSHPR
jgi:hypothetical protein